MQTRHNERNAYGPLVEHRKITDLCIAGNLPVDRGRVMVGNLMKFGLIIEIGVEGEKEYGLTDRGYEWLGLYNLLKKTSPI
jgi:predicted transcriptional regulator